MAEGILHNSYRENAGVYGGMMNNSGPIVNPIMGFLAGKNLKQAQDKDVEIEGNYLSQMKRKQDVEEGKQLWEIISKVSESDPVEATKMLESAGKTNSMLAKFQGIKFISNSDKDWFFVQDGEGQQLAVNKRGLEYMSQHPDQAEKVKDQYIRPIGGKKAKTPVSLSPGSKLLTPEGKELANNPKSIDQVSPVDEFHAKTQKEIKQMELDNANKGKVLTQPEIVKELTSLYQSIRIKTKDTSITDALLQSALSNDSRAQSILASKIKASGAENDEGLKGVMQSIKYWQSKYKETSGEDFMPRAPLAPDIAAQEARRRGLIK